LTDAGVVDQMSLTPSRRHVVAGPMDGALKYKDWIMEFDLTNPPRR
jgi:hypothetical protein